MTEPIVIGAGPLVESTVVAVARGRAQVVLAAGVVEAVDAGRRRLLESAPALVAPGGSRLSRVDPAATRLGGSVSDSVDDEVVRAALLCRLRNLASGRLGARGQTVRAVAALLNAGVTPHVQTTTDDESFLDRLSALLTGDGLARGPEGALPARDALALAGLEPSTLDEWEHDALVRGGDATLAALVLACHDTEALIDTADVAAALAIEASDGDARALAPEARALRRHPGQAQSARHMVKVLDGARAGVGADEVARVAPHVAGAARDTLTHVRLVLARESASTAGEHALLADGTVVVTGNSHGAPLALAAEFLTIALAELGAHSRARLAMASTGATPPLATAALSAVDDLRTSGAMLDAPTSGAWPTAMRTHDAVDRLSRLLAAELLAASAGEPRAPVASAVVRRVREVAGGGLDAVAQAARAGEFRAVS